MSTALDLQKVLQDMGYPSREARKDLWADPPRAAIGLPDTENTTSRVLYFEGLPRAVVVAGMEPEQALAYAAGAAFSNPPPLVIVTNTNSEAKAYVRDGADYRIAPAVPSWEEAVSLPAGRVSSGQARLAIEHIADGNRHWYRDERSKKVVGILPRIFPEGTVILYELLQNAADSRATKASFQLEEDNLLFMHDGCPFTENDVHAISFVNSSFKPPDTIGFMGLGFKAAYEITDQPEIHSPPFCFRFDKTEDGGELFPIPTSCDSHEKTEFTTVFRFPLKAQARPGIEHELKHFDGHPLLYIGGRLGQVATPYCSYTVNEKEKRGNVRLVELRDVLSGWGAEFAIFTRDFEPTPGAAEEFAANRRVEPSQYLGKPQRIAAAVRLNEGGPDYGRPGRLQVYLPTHVRLPLAFDLQGNFLVDASRQELRSAAGPWNWEHFANLPHLVAEMLLWAKQRADAEDDNWTRWYSLIPDWGQLAESIGLDASDLDGPGDTDMPATWLRAATSELLAANKLVPAGNRDGRLSFVTPAEAICADKGLESILNPADLARLTGKSPLLPDLTDDARPVLATYVDYFGPIKFKALLEAEDWEANISALARDPDSRNGRVQLAKILAYLENKSSEYPGDLSNCRVVLTQLRRLRAAREEDAPPVRSLSDIETGFPTEELAAHFEIVHPRFRRDLSRPGETGLDAAVNQQAIRALNKIAPALDPETIAKEIILPLFRGSQWEEIPDERLLRYTQFLVRNRKNLAAQLSSGAVKVKVKGAERRYVPSHQAYLSESYSDEGRRLERISQEEGALFLADDYLSLARTERDDWLDFFSALGVRTKPQIIREPAYFHAQDIGAVKEACGKPDLPNRDLRVNPLDDIPGENYAVDDYELHLPFARAVKKLYEQHPFGWKDRLADFAQLIENNWTYYKRFLRKQLRYALRYEQTARTVPVAESSFARFLTDEPWVPAFDVATARKPSELVLDTQENRELAGDETLLPYYGFRNQEVIDFLGVLLHPPDSTPLLRLRNAVDRKESNPDFFRSRYTEIANDPRLNRVELRAAFRDHPLIYVPEHDPSYISSEHALYVDRTVLRPHFIAIADVYPELGDFFTDLLAIPAEEQLGHFVRFLRDYVWKERPPTTDTLRSAVESCYRKFFSHLNETEDNDRQEALQQLKESLGSPTFAFCARQGWVSTTTKTVVYPDTRTYESFLEREPSVAIESHLKRLAQPLSELRPLLEALNILPISDVVKIEPEIKDSQVLNNNELLADNLSLLLRAVIELVESEQRQSESSSRNIVLFLTEWQRLRPMLSDIRFYGASEIHIKGQLTENSYTLFEQPQRAYVGTLSNRLEIYISGNILDVFDAIADQLKQALRIDLLPISLRDEVSSLVQSSLATLDRLQFYAHLGGRLRERGLTIEPDGELASILAQLTQDVEDSVEESSDAAQTETLAGQDGDEGSDAGDNISSGGSGRGHPGGTQPSDGGQPSVPTADEILAALPVFDDGSFGSGRVVDLTGSTEWQENQQKQPGPRGGGAGGGGGFRRMKAYLEAYGKRGEQWVVQQEKKLLTQAGRPDLAERVVRRSLESEGSPWDIESFEKSPPHSPVYIEVKSTPDPADLEVDMSVEQIRQAIQPGRPYYLYRVLAVDTSTPHAYIYNFKKIVQHVKFSATNVSVTLPKPAGSDNTSST